MRLVVLALWCGLVECLKRKRVLVVGSANLDTTLAVGPRLPVGGETIVTRGDPEVCCGGKGLNQAVACAKLGGGALDVAMACVVGRDGAGDALVAGLEAAGVDCGFVSRSEAAATGQGFVVLEDGGRVLSIVVRGANFDWDDGAHDDAWAARVVAGADVVLLRRETRVRRSQLRKAPLSVGCPLISADVSTSARLSERYRSVHVLSGTRARGTPTSKRRRITRRVPPRSSSSARSRSGSTSASPSRRRRPVPSSSRTAAARTGPSPRRTSSAAPTSRRTLGSKRVRRWPTSKAPISVVFHSFRLSFGRVIISRNGLEA